MNYRPLPEPSYAKIGKEKIECNKCKPNCYVNAMKGAGNKMLVSFNYYNVFSTLWIKTWKLSNNSEINFLKGDRLIL